MGKVIFLGTAFAVPDELHENTHMAFVHNSRTILVDCASNPILQLRRAGIPFDSLNDLVLTHFHPDHVSGVPLLLMGMWLLGRTQSLDIYGLAHTIDRIETVMKLYDSQKWPGFFPIYYHRIPEEECALVLEIPGFRLYSSPVKHLIPTIGLRAEFLESKKMIAYSCDTEPCEQVVNLAKDVDILVHEASGGSEGHSSSEQAAKIAAQAGARSLYLIHYPTRAEEQEESLRTAQAVFQGPVYLAQDFMSLDL